MKDRIEARKEKKNRGGEGWPPSPWEFVAKAAEHNGDSLDQKTHWWEHRGERI